MNTLSPRRRPIDPPAGAGPKHVFASGLGPNTCAVLRPARVLVSRSAKDTSGARGVLGGGVLDLLHARPTGHVRCLVRPYEAMGQRASPCRPYSVLVHATVFQAATMPLA